MKRLICCVIALSLLICLYSCEVVSQSPETSKRATEWYKAFPEDDYTFSYTMDDSSGSYRYTFSWDGSSMTSLYKSLDDNSSIYEIDDGNAVYVVYPSENAYYKKESDGGKNLCAGYSSYNRGTPSTTGTSVFMGKNMYFEKYGNDKSYTCYYFDGDDLYAIESVTASGSNVDTTVMYDIEIKASSKDILHAVPQNYLEKDALEFGVEIDVGNESFWN